MPDRFSASFPRELVCPSVFGTPLRLTDKDSWHGHIPFAFWCIEALRPRLLVELGCYKGDSYCAFCQAVEENAADTRCYAVDTWKGDALAGFYGEAVYEELRQYHDPRYGGFSSLVRSSFDEALPRFADASIDLLHIDGSHGYQEVRHDFSTWLPKLSPSGVVLLHDTEVREPGFGVWRLWAEIRRAYPSFSFPHSVGLGVVAVGADPSPAMRRLTGLDARGTEDVRRLFARLGDAVRLQSAHQLLARRRVRVAELEVRDAELQVHVAQLEAARQALTASHQALEALLQERERQVAALKAHGDAVEAQREALLRSTSWKVSAPVRSAGRLLRRLRGRSGEPEELEALDPAAAAPEPEPESEPHATASAPTPPVPAPPPPTFERELLRDPSWTLVFPRAERPEVSLIVVTLNNAELTYECLESLLAHADVPYELILVDNGSTDQTGELLRRLRNVTVLRNDANLGFGTACNQAAARATGDFLLFLNNDATLAPGCLGALLEAARSDARVGAVGGRLVWPDGRLQEAGSILWSDGTAEAYGRGSRPFAPEYSFRREVDFCSGALLLVRREPFEKLGGFDERFAPAYCEDADLCFGLRRLGYSVVYEPGATACHHEYGSSSAEGAIALMQRNHARFAEKWGDDLLRQHPRSAGCLRARERVERPRLLVVDDRVPTSNAGSGYPRAHALLRLLRRRGYPVTFFPAYDSTPYQPWLREFQRSGVEVICDGRPFSGLAEERAGLYPVVFVSRPHNFSEVRAELSRSLPSAVVIYDAEALFFVREAAKTAAGEDSAVDEVALRQRQELSLMRFAHLVVAVSEREKRLLAQADPDFRGQIAVWGHAIEARPTPASFAERRDLLFLGSFIAPRSPNKDALSFFVTEVLPLVNRQLDCRLQVVGYNAEEAVGGYASDRVRVVGYAEDPTPYYAGCRVFVVPHQYSAGIPWKLSEAMARGLPAVVSELTAAQLGVEDGREVLVGGTPAELAAQVVRLYKDEALWNEVRANALEFVRRQHDPEMLGRALDDLIAGALAAGPTSTD